jgi:hypothetical protein
MPADTVRIPELIATDDGLMIPHVAPPTLSIEVRQRAIVLAALKDSIRVSNSVEYEHALEQQKDIRNQIDVIEAAYKPAIEKLRPILDGWYEDVRVLRKPLEAADKAVGAAALSWKNAEEQRARDEQRRLQAEADARAQAERDAQLKARQAEAARLAKKDPKAAAAVREEAAQLAAQPVVAATVHVDANVPTVAGIAAGEKWVCREDAVDIKKLCEAVAKGWCDTIAVVPNWKYLNGRAKLDKEKFNQADPKTKRTPWPGVVAYNAGSTRRS